MDMKVIKEYLIRIFLVLFSTIVSIIIVAFALELHDYLDRGSKYYVLPPYFKQYFQFVPDAMPGIYNASRITINSEGMRAPEIKSKFDGYILAVGGSTTACTFLDDSEVWTQILQNKFNSVKSNSLWVGNVGRNGHNSLHHTVQVRYLLEQYPFIDTVILLVGINDLLRVLIKDDDYVHRDVDSSKYNSEIMEQAFKVHPKNEIPHFKDLKLYKKVSTVFNPKPPSADRLDTVGRFMAKWRKQRKDANEYIDTLPDLSQGKKTFLLHLNKIVKNANEHDVRLILLTQPSIYRDNMSDYEKDLLWVGWIKERGSEKYYSMKALKQGLEYYNETILDFCDEEKIECLDLANEIPKSTISFYDDVHFTEMGSKLVADAVYQYLIDNPRH